MAADYEKLGLFYLGKRYDLAANARLGGLDPLRLARSAHPCGLLGMTGSGKTGLGITMLEEAAIDGVPVLAIDPKGDLTNLLLTFPNLAPSDFAPWVDRAEAAAPADDASMRIAADLATRWKSGPSRVGSGWKPDRAPACGRRHACLYAGQPCRHAAGDTRTDRSDAARAGGGCAGQDHGNGRRSARTGRDRPTCSRTAGSRR